VGKTIFIFKNTFNIELKSKMKVNWKRSTAQRCQALFFIWKWKWKQNENKNESEM